MLLYIMVSSITAFLGSSFSIFPVMRSNPGALCELVKLISLRTSAGVSGRGGRDNCPGASRYSFITISKVGSLDGRGMNTCARSYQNISRSSTPHTSNYRTLASLPLCLGTGN